MEKKDIPLEINMKIEINKEVFNGLPKDTKEVFMILIKSELGKMASSLSQKTSMWMYQMRRPYLEDKDGMD